MFDAAAFRAGEFSVPYASKEELPPCCFDCVYLHVEETTVCFCESFYYVCASSWPDKLTHTVPPCLQDP
jgi:hypothetical protein